MQKKSFEEAIQPFTQILVLEPTNINSLEKLGHCYYFSGRDKEAEESYIRAIRISNLTP
jgi:Flp pilus assembly protein TadD